MRVDLRGLEPSIVLVAVLEVGTPNNATMKAASMSIQFLLLVALLEDDNDNDKHETSVPARRLNQ